MENVEEKADDFQQQQPERQQSEPIDIPYKVHCLHCRAVRTIAKPVKGVTTRNRLIIKGECEECQNKVARFI